MLKQVHFHDHLDSSWVQKSDCQYLKQVIFGSFQTEAQTELSQKKKNALKEADLLLKTHIFVKLFI